MKRLLSLLLLLSAMQSVAAVPAAADVPAAANNVPAAGRADAILAGVSDGFRALGAYGVSFEVRSDEYVTRGRYAVEGENYYLVLGDAEVYCDGAVRYEVDNRRREVTIDVVDTGSRNILNNPVHAFDFLGSEYAASLAGEQEGRAVVRLTPAPGNTSSKRRSRPLRRITTPGTNSSTSADHVPPADYAAVVRRHPRGDAGCGAGRPVAGGRAYPCRRT